MKTNHAYSPASLRVGFTLVELLVVIAILAILATISFPSFQRQVAEYRVTSHANSVQGLIQFARTEAIKRTARVAVCFDEDDEDLNTLFVRVSTDCPVEVDCPVCPVGVGPGDLGNLRVLSLDARVQIDGIADGVSFEPSGHTRNPGAFDVIDRPGFVDGRQILLIGSGFSEIRSP